MTVSALARFMAIFICLPTFTILEVTVLLAVADNNIFLDIVKLRDVLVEVLDLVDLFTLQLALLLCYLLEPYLVNEFYLVFTRLAPALLRIAKEAVLEALAVPVKTVLAIVTSRIVVLTLCSRHIVVEKFF